MNGRIRCWWLARIAAVLVIATGFCALPIGLLAYRDTQVASVEPAVFRRLAFGSLSLIPLGIALFMLCQRRLLQAALAEGRSAGNDTALSPSVLKGGAQAAGRRVSYPLARLTVERRRLTIHMLGEPRFTCERNEVTSLAPQSWLLGSGLTIQAHSPARTAVFWPRDPVALVRALRRANYPL